MTIKFSHFEIDGIKDFLNSQPDAELAINLASIISRNAIKCESLSDAIDVILLHSSSIQSILNRKPITKNILFKYLHENRVPVTTAVTKQLLVEKIIQYWNEKNSTSTAETPQFAQFAQQNEHAENNEKSVEPIDNDRQHFPINEMSRTFANWFFDHLNTNKTQINDFWTDVNCEASFYENKSVVKSDQLSGAEYVLSFLTSLIHDYQLYFNLNDCHAGVQGRMDTHGLVLVLSCGTLHKTEQFVGTFESVFGLLRDPFAENNWKIKQINIRLHNTLSKCSAQPSLTDCESLEPLLCLYAPATIEEIQ